ncbi:hypothetical protein BJ166DRAFT_22555 [Pestalotiopsis sp. NC0098]|nr:hypothetical protein BJ166DRAFT_22555 [Pestalotiopsis sp. NC0098]
MRISKSIALASWGAGVLAFDNKFLFPAGKDLTLYYMNTVEVQYQSNFFDPTLHTYCKVDGGDPREDSKTSVPDYNGTVSVTLDWVVEYTECWFALEPANSQESGFNSEHWSYEIKDANITTVQAKDETKKLSAKTLASSVTATESATANAAPHPTFVNKEPAATSEPTSEPAPTPESRGVIIGIAVGATFGALILMTILGMVFARYCRRNKPYKNYNSVSPAELGLLAEGAPQKPAGAVSYNHVSPFEPSGTSDSAPYDPHRR